MQFSPYCSAKSSKFCISEDHCNQIDIAGLAYLRNWVYSGVAKNVGSDASVWGKTTEITGCLGGAGVGPSSCKIGTFFHFTKTHIVSHFYSQFMQLTTIGAKCYMTKSSPYESWHFKKLLLIRDFWACFWNIKFYYF